MRKELLIGCGRNREKQVIMEERKEWGELVTLDICPLHSPDVLHDLNVLPLPFNVEEFDEIHAYEVLEHIGKQGDYKGFFNEFQEYYRILKPNGYFCGSVPLRTSVWAWGDPGHTRVLSAETFQFLSQEFYQQVGITAATDYRDVYSGDFKLVALQEVKERLYFAMRKIPRGESNGTSN